MKLLRTSSSLLCGTLKKIGTAMLSPVLLLVASQVALAQTTADLVERYMTTVQAEFASKVDTKNAAAGQKVTLLTKKAATLADGTELPKGTRLVGRIVEVHASGNERSGSALTLIFDQAELGGGKVLPVRSLMRTLSPMTANPSGASFGQSDPMRAEQPGVTPGGGTYPRAANGRDEDVRGGLGSNDPFGSGNVGSRTTRPGVGLPSPVPATIPGSSSEGPRATRDGGVTVGSTPQATGLDGVLLAKKTVGADGVAIDASGTLIGLGRNVHLETGTLIVLGVIGR